MLPNLGDIQSDKDSDKPPTGFPTAISDNSVKLSFSDSPVRTLFRPLPQELTLKGWQIGRHAGFASRTYVHSCHEPPTSAIMVFYATEDELQNLLNGWLD